MNPADQSTGLYACVCQMLQDLRAAHSLPVPSPDENELYIRAYSFALAEVPLEDFPQLTARLIRDLPDNFMPAAGQVLAFYERMSGMGPRNAANSGAYVPYKPTGQEVRYLPEGAGSGREAWRLLGEKMRGGKHNVVCDCGDPAAVDDRASKWICPNLKDRACNFSLPTAETLHAPNEGRPGPLAGSLGALRQASVQLDKPTLPVDDNDLLDELAARTNFDVLRPESLDFARYLLKRVPAAKWNLDTARQEWAGFCALKKAGETVGQAA